MERRRNRTTHLVSTAPFVYCVSTCLLLLCVCCVLLFFRTIIGSTTVPPLLDTPSLSSQQANSYMNTQGIEKHVVRKEEERASSRTIQQSKWKSRRHLNGLGSYPPRCKSKCGKCTPCKAVHVPVPPGTSAPTEYYPEAWRCKCGNKMYMP